MALIPKRVVTDNGTGAVIKYGRTDFTGGFNPAIETQHTLDDTANFTVDVPNYYHKVVGTLLQEMTPAEKTAVDAYLDAKETALLKFPAVVQKIVPNLAALPVPPPKMGVIIGVTNISGSPGIAISTNVNYIVFQSDGVHP
jgi:hypothetical protein